MVALVNDAMWGLNRRDTESDDFDQARDRLVDRLERVGRIERRSTDEAMREVPRHEFVPENRRRDAYADRPLPIGSGQTISAPHMAAIMLDHLELETGDRILEIGTGCGYHTALTAEVVGAENVFSVEYHEELAERARGTLRRLGYDGVSIRVGDGHEGMLEHAPYDAAYLTCAPSSVPAPILEQVPDGVVLAPVGNRSQRLVRIVRRAGETVDRAHHGGVRFVGMLGER